MSKALGSVFVFFLIVCGLSSQVFAQTYYVAANGSDANAGTSKTAPWQHAPGMPNCTSACGVKQSAGINPGDQFIFRGGDTWHFGNPAASPYTGGAWGIPWPSNHSNNTCIYGSTSTCAYYGVDQTWYSGTSWTRPIMTGDNPTSGSPVAACQYAVPGSSGPYLGMIRPAIGSIFDNFEITGYCVDTTANFLINPIASNRETAFITNTYIHGWSITNATYALSSMVCTLIGGNSNGLLVMHHNVIDGSDSKANTCAWGTFPSFYHFFSNYVGYTTQGVGQACHNIHDNIFEVFDNPLTDSSTAKTHGNVLECNTDLAGNPPAPNPQNTPNVFYNNIVRHATTNFSLAGQVALWHAPRYMDEYWFNNVMYDLGNNGNFWAVCWPAAGLETTAQCAGAAGTNVNYPGKIRMFNNTLADGLQPCSLPGSNALEAYNEHLINTPFYPTGNCFTAADTSNVKMTDAVAVSLGFGTYSGLINKQQASTINCANEITQPCVPTVNTSPTIGVGLNLQNYCTLLAGYTQEPAISVDAANACKYGTTDACTYNKITHTMQCPGQTAVPRPTGTIAWDAGAYLFSAVRTQTVQPPSNLTVVTQ